MFPYHDEWLIGLYALYLGALLEAFAVRRRYRAEPASERLLVEPAPTRA